MKKLLSLVLAVALLVCAAVPALAEDAKSISYYAYWCGTAGQESYVEKYVEEKTGLNIEVSTVAHTDTEAVSLMLASGEMPDCGWFTQTSTYMYDQELVRTIPVDMVKEFAPGLIEMYDKNPILYAVGLDPEDDTQFKFLPGMYDTYTALYLYCHYINYDYVKALNLDLGVNVEQVSDYLYVADKGISLDTMYTLLDAFVNQDPNGTGAADTVGLIKNYTDFMSAFGLINDCMEYEGKPIQWYTHPKVKELLSWLQKAYADGLIYKEIFTIGWGEDWELINSGAAGLNASSSTNALNSWASTRPPRTLLDNGVSVLMIPGVADENGATPRNLTVNPAGGEKFFVNADVSDEKLAEILKFFQFCYFSGDDEINATLWFGEKGVDWNWNEAGDTPVSISGATSGVNGTQIFCRNIQIDKCWEWITYEADFKAGAKYYVNGTWNEDLVVPYKNDIYNETEAATISNEYNADWTTVRNAYFMAVIMGEKNLDSDWDAYIAELNSLEYDAYLEELDKAPTVESILEKFS